MPADHEPRVSYGIPYTLKYQTNIVSDMARTKVTSKYQVTIPRDVREKVEVRPGEVVTMEALSANEILLRVYPRKADPLSVLIGRRRRLPEVPVEELEERAESR